MINPTHKLQSELTIKLAAGEEAYIDIYGYISSCVLSLQLLDFDAKVVIQSTITSTEYIKENKDLVHDDLLWEYCTINDVVYEEVDFAIPSYAIYAPSLLYIKNTSLASQEVLFSIRGSE